MCSLLSKSYVSSSAACRYSCEMIKSHALRRINTFGKQQQVESVLTMKKNAQFAVRSLTVADIPQVMDIRRQMGAIEVESCLRSWITLDPGCIKVAVTNEDEVIGTCSNVKIGDGEDDFCFGGMFCVKPEYQNQGIGVSLWSSCYEHVGNHNSGLNAVPGKLDVYRTAGYPIYDDSFTTVEYRITSYNFTSCFSNTPPPGIRIRSFHRTHLPSVYVYDHDLVGFSRYAALGLNLLEPGSRTLVALRNDSVPVGFGTVKLTCTGAVRVGPLYADGPEVGEVLLRRLVGMMNAPGFLFVTTSGNPHVKKWMDRGGVMPWKICDRLYKKEKLGPIDLEKVFALFDVNFAPF